MALTSNSLLKLASYLEQHYSDSLEHAEHIESFKSFVTEAKYIDVLNLVISNSDFESLTDEAFRLRARLLARIELDNKEFNRIVRRDSEVEKWFDTAFGDWSISDQVAHITDFFSPFSKSFSLILTYSQEAIQEEIQSQQQSS